MRRKDESKKPIISDFINAFYYGIAVLGTVACGPGQEEEQRFVETIRMPETLVEKGDCFALIAKGESIP